MTLKVQHCLLVLLSHLHLGRSFILRMGAIYLLQSLLVTWPLVMNIEDHVVGHTLREATPPLNAWAMAQVLRQLPTHPLAIFDGNAFYPYSHTLAYSEHLFVPALLGSPIYYLTHNLVLTYNVVTLLMLILAGLGMCLFAHELTGNSVAAWAAGSLYAFHTWNINELVRLQILSNSFFPFLLLALLRYYQRPSARRAIAVAVLAAMQGLSCMYWALYLPILIIPTIMLLWYRSGRPARESLPLLAALSVAALPVIIFAIPYVITARTLDLGRDLPLPLPLNNYLAVLPTSVIYGGWLPTARYDQLAAHFLGLAAMVLAIYSIKPLSTDTTPTRWVRPGLVALVVLGGALSLGPVITWSKDALLPGPYALLWHYVPGFRNVRYPERMSLFVTLGLAPLVAIAIDRIYRNGLRVLAGVLAGLVWIEHLAIPQYLSPLPSPAQVPSVYKYIARDDSIRVVAELPVPRYKLERLEALNMFLSTYHWKRIVQAYTSYFPPTYNFMRWRLSQLPDPEAIRFAERYGIDTLLLQPTEGGLAPQFLSNGATRVIGPFPEGHVLVRLNSARAPVFTMPKQDDQGFTPLSREGWKVNASRPGALLAIDGNDDTDWDTQTEPQRKGDFYRIQFSHPSIVTRVVLDVRRPYEFPLHVTLIGQTSEQETITIPFNETEAYDRLFASLLLNPRHAALVLDFPAQRLTGIRVRIDQSDAFGLPWSLSEIHAYSLR